MVQKINWTINGTIDFEGSYDDFVASLYNFNQLYRVPLSSNNINCIRYECNGVQTFAYPIYLKPGDFLVGYKIERLS